MGEALVATGVDFQLSKPNTTDFEFAPQSPPQILRFPDTYRWPGVSPGSSLLQNDLTNILAMLF